ncbi:hypothetical protein ACOME3_007670 [Neoechinorhynchus agilis]
MPSLAPTFLLFQPGLGSHTVAKSKSARYVIAGDFNGLVGSRGGYERVHGGHSIRLRNAEGEKLLDFAMGSTMERIEKRKNDSPRTLGITASGNSSTLDGPNKKETIYSENELQNQVVDAKRYGAA